MAAQTPNRQDADEPETGVDDAVTTAAVEDDDTTAVEADDTPAVEADRSLWEATRIDPVSIALLDVLVARSVTGHRRGALRWRGRVLPGP